MDALIAIPDLDDDQIYPLESSAAAEPSTGPARPFRGHAAGLDHTRSGSNISFDSSAGSRTGAGAAAGSGSAHGVHGYSNGASGSGSSSSLLRGLNGAQTGSGSTAQHSAAAGAVSSAAPSMPSFPRKGSFASLKAAFNKGPSTPTQDAYPQQLRNPFGNTSNKSDLSTSTTYIQSDSTPRVHARQDSFLSSSSRGRLPPSSSLRHLQQTSQTSDTSQMASTSMTDIHSGGGQAFRRAGTGVPTMPSFPEDQSEGMPPAKTAYARSIAHAQAAQANRPRFEQDNDQAYYDHNEMASAHGAQYGHTYEESNASHLLDVNGGYHGEAHSPLLPPSRPFAEAAHGRSGSSGGSLGMSEGGQVPAGMRTPGGSSNSRQADPFQAHAVYVNRDNSSIASLPAGIGVENPSTPAEYAINVLCSRFMTLAGVRIRGAMGGVDEADPPLATHLAKGSDVALDTLIESLAHISRKSPRPVIESLLHWRETVAEERVDVGEVRGALAGSHAGLSLGVKTVADVLARRKRLATAFLLARVLTEVASHFAPGGPDNPVKGLSEAQLNSLNGQAFELMRECSRDRCPPSKMQADAFESAASLLGELSKSSFVSIGDRFVAYLEQCQRTVPTSKDGDGPTETAIWAMRHLIITPYPMELFEEGAEFFETIAKFFSNAHGQRIKSGYAEALTQLILPVAKSASAELHHPTWIRALDFIGPRAFAMLQKPRYWLVAYPLYAAVLCVSPEERFLQASQSWSWFACLEAGVTKMSKDRTARDVVLNTALWLLWTYLFRCRESSTTTTKRLDAYFRMWYPQQRQTIWPIDLVTIDWHVHMVHYALYRQFDFGRDLVLDFLKHSALSGNKLSLQPELLSRQRMTIAIRAIVLTLDAHVRGESPAFPSESSFALDRDGSGDELPEGYNYPTAEIGTAQATFNDLIGKIALLCDHAVGGLTVMDENALLTKGTSLSAAAAASKGTVDEDRLHWRVHESHDFVAAYPKENQATMDLLRTCIESWPRCLSASVNFASVLSILFRAQFSVDPKLASAASQCLTRLARQRKGGAVTVVSSYMRSIVRLQSIAWESHAKQHLILSKIERAIRLLVKLLDLWLTDLRKTQAGGDGQKGWEMERTSAWAVVDEVESIGLFLLCSAWRLLRRQAIGVLRAVEDLDDVLAGSAQRDLPTGIDGQPGTQEPTRIIHLLNLPVERFVKPTDPKAALEPEQAGAKVQKWKRSTAAEETLIEVAESDKSSEPNAWSLVVPRFLRACLEHFPTTVAVFRSIVATRIFGMEAVVSLTAGISNRAVANTHTLKSTGAAAASSLMSFAVGSGSLAHAASAGGLNQEQILMSEHWKMYVLALCTTTTSIEGGAQRMLHGEGSAERVIAAKDLFQKMVPYLASDQPRFQEAVIVALGNINVNLYKTLLETLQMVNSQLSDDFRRGGSKRNRRNERLRTALAQVVQLTSPHMTRERALSDQSIVFLVLQWVKDTFNFLTDRDIRSDWEFHQLRRYFAGVVEEFFEALQRNKRSGNDAAERFLTFDTRLHMFRLFREWHSYSQAAKDGPARLTNLLASAAEKHRDDRNREHVLSHLRTETQLLSYQASSAMAALCQGSMTLSENSAQNTQHLGTVLDSRGLIEWLDYLFRSTTTQNHNVASRALRGLLRHNMSNAALAQETLELAFREPDSRLAANSFFSVFSDVIVEQGLHHTEEIIAWQQIACLGLIKLGHADVATRRKAFAMLNCIVQAELSSSSMQALEGGVTSPLPATYLRAQRDVSTHLATRFPQHKVAMLSEYTRRLPDIDVTRRATTLGLLPEWLSQIKLLTEHEQQVRGVMLPHRATLVLTNLLAMTVRYGDEHNFEVQDMWASLAESDDYGQNASIMAKFLIQQALIVRSSSLIMHAKRAVSCLSHTVLANALFLEFCSYIEPSSMIPVPLEVERTVATEASLQHLHMSNLDQLLPTPSRRQTFSPGQVALLYVGELTYEKTPLLLEKLPLLLHAVFMQVDSLSTFTQEQVMAMFEQLMRLVNAEQGDSDEAVKVDSLFGKGTSIFWTQDDDDYDASSTLASMRATVVSTIDLLDNHYTNLNVAWGNVALHWATSNPVRHMACRSFQLFRILLPKINYTMLADMLGRLSNTISDSVRVDNQSFALEILYTLNAIVHSIKANGAAGQDELLSHVYWMGVACLSTVNEAEFGHSITLMLALLECVDLNHKDTIVLLKAKCPEAWEGDTASLQGLVMRGFKSSALCDDSFRLLAKLSQVSYDDLIESSDCRVGYLFMVCMPWFLQMTDDASEIDEVLVSGLAQDIATLAHKHSQVDIERVAESIAKKRFRTKDDLLRQAVGSCKRSGFIPKHTSSLVFLLLGLTFNAQDWIRKQTLQILKILFQSMDAKRRDLDEYGPELLMPLLRLLSTSHSMEALEVLDERILTSAPSIQRMGPNAQQILRMSLLWNKSPAPAPTQLVRRGTKGGRGGMLGRRPTRTAYVAQLSVPTSVNGAQDVNSLFGLPEESGWSVANVPEWTTRTRINILSVFKEVELLLDTPPVGEVNFVDDYDADGENIFEHTMTVSHNEADDDGADDVERYPRYPRSGRNEHDGSLMESESMTSHSRGARSSIGDIVNQLHDLSSFFIDDEAVSIEGVDDSQGHSHASMSRRQGSEQSSPQSVRKHTFWASLSSSNQHGSSASTTNDGDASGDVAKILGRSALAAMMGRGHGSRVTSGTSDESQNTPTPLAHELRSDGDYLTSKALKDEVSPKRSGVFGRKSFFGRKVTPTPMTRTASDTRSDRTSPRQSEHMPIDAHAEDEEHIEAPIASNET